MKTWTYKSRINRANKKVRELPLQGVQVQSLVRKVRSHMLHGTAKKKKKLCDAAKAVFKGKYRALCLH